MRDTLREGHRYLTNEEPAGRSLIRFNFQHPPTIFKDRETGREHFVPFHTPESVRAATEADDARRLQPIVYTGVGVYCPVALTLFRRKDAIGLLQIILGKHAFVGYGPEANQRGPNLLPRYPVIFTDGVPTPRHRTYLQIITTLN